MYTCWGIKLTLTWGNIFFLLRITSYILSYHWLGSKVDLEWCVLSTNSKIVDLLRINIFMYHMIFFHSPTKCIFCINWIMVLCVLCALILMHFWPLMHEFLMDWWSGPVLASRNNLPSLKPDVLLLYPFSLWTLCSVPHWYQINCLRPNYCFPERPEEYAQMFLMF